MSQPAVSLPRGDTITLLFIILNPDGSQSNLTGATIIWRLADPPQGGEIFATKDNGSLGGVTITDAIAGKFAVPVLEGDTLNLTPRTYWQEAEVRLSNGTVTTVGGVFQVTPTVRPS